MFSNRLGLGIDRMNLEVVIQQTATPTAPLPTNAAVAPGGSIQVWIPGPGERPRADCRPRAKPLEGQSPGKQERPARQRIHGVMAGMRHPKR